MANDEKIFVYQTYILISHLTIEHLFSRLQLALKTPNRYLTHFSLLQKPKHTQSHCSTLTYFDPLTLTIPSTPTFSISTASAHTQANTCRCMLAKSWL
jgi:hypothetical protein